MTNVIAHRGASAARPENTIEAFRYARSLGADGVELDVRRSADGQAVVCHDAWLSDGRMIADLATEELPVGTPLLAESLAGCEGMDIHVEIKNASAEPDHDPAQMLASVVVDQVRAAGLGDRVVVSSFGFATIDRVRALEPHVATAWLVIDRGDPAALIERTSAAGHAGIHPVHRMVDRDLVARAHDAGLFVNVWTVDDPDKIRRLAELGVDGVITNVPDVALVALGRG